MLKMHIHWDSIDGKCITQCPHNIIGKNNLIKMVGSVGCSCNCKYFIKYINYIDKILLCRYGIDTLINLRG